MTSRFIITERQQEVLDLIKNDNWINNREIAEKLKIRHKTVRFHLCNINVILGTKYRRDIVRLLNKD